LIVYLNLNTGVLQTLQVYNPGFLLLFNGLENAGSVPWFCVTLRAIGDRWFRFIILSFESKTNEFNQIGYFWLLPSSGVLRRKIFVIKDNMSICKTDLYLN
jgi:hypothetical protein